MNRVILRIMAGQGAKEDLHLLVDVAGRIEGHTICALGDAAAWPVQSFIRHFRHEFEYMIDNGGRSIVEIPRRGRHERVPPATPGLRPPPSDVVNVEIDGEPCQGKKGQMIIHVTDAQNAYVPRFCYHEKLPIAANCRMCLVEVEKAPKPLPACATPITEGMNVFTTSPRPSARRSR